MIKVFFAKGQPIALLLVVLLMSCHKTYKFKIRNETDYRLSDVNISFENNYHFSVEPNSSSEVFSIKHKIGIINLVAAADLIIMVKSYADSNGNTFENTGGTDFNTGDFKKGTNTIVISKSQNSISGTIFSYNLE